MSSLDLFFYPVCPWASMTARWVVDVAPQRNVPVRWRAYSLHIENEGIEIPEPYREMSATSRGALRVVGAVWEECGDEPPTGDAAVALWDHVVALAWTPGFFELKRSGTAPPQLQAVR